MLSLCVEIVKRCPISITKIRLDTAASEPFTISGQIDIGGQPDQLMRMTARQRIHILSTLTTTTPPIGQGFPAGHVEPINLIIG